MTEFKAILVDDEPRGLASLQKLLQMHCPQVEVLATCLNANDAKEKIQSLHPNLVFLDIAMPEKSGMALLQELGEIDFEVIFISAYNDYMSQAFHFSAVDYLLKPVDEDLLAEAVLRAGKRIRQKTAGQQAARETGIDTLMHNIENRTTTQKMKLCIPSLKGFQVVTIQDIVCCVASGNYTSFQFINRPPILASKPLNEYEELLADCSFVRAHKSYLVNLEHVKEYLRGEGGALLMADGTEIEVSRRKKDSLLIKMRSFFKF
jgi:two-component system LytT family response regulator